MTSCSKINPVLKTTLFFLIAVILLVAGCAKIPLSYWPSSLGETSGSISISDFRYLPAEKGMVKPFQIRETMLKKLKFNKNIDMFFKDAVYKELYFNGIKLDDKTRVLSGEIEDFLIENLRDSADWTLKVHYQIKNLSTGETIYEATKNTKRNASKLINVSSGVSEMIKLNIEELIHDEEFIEAIN